MVGALARPRAARRVLSIAGAVALTAAMGAGTAEAALTSPADGTVYRDGAVPISESVGARFVKADGATEMSALEKLACQTRSTANPNARTARTLITVVRVSDNAVVFQGEKPNQSALPSLLNDQGGAWSTAWAIPENAAAGAYQVRSTAENRRRVSAANPCQLETVLLDTRTIEYRPWQHTFKDVFGGGRVSMNVQPAEYQPAVGGQTGAIRPGGTAMTFYALPGASTFALPSDPAGCAADPASCLPSSAVACVPAQGCVPRLVVVNRRVAPEPVVGIFDLETKAFIALAEVNGHRRVLVSLGTKQDAVHAGLLTQLAAAAQKQGIDLVSLLATKVRVRTGAQEVGLSLLNGLQIQPSGAPGGVQIVSGATVQAGVILNIFASLGGTGCQATAGDSDPSTPAPDRVRHTGDVGYDVERADLLPDVPRLGAVGALVGGPIYHITGDFVGATPPLVNTTTAVIGADTAADEPNGYPVWIQPFVSGIHVKAARTMDFLGTATWSATETPVGTACLTVDFMLGTGVAVFDNPLPVGFGTLPFWDPAAPEVRALMTSVNQAVQNVVDTVVSDPTVDALLDQVLGSLPAVPALP